MIMKKILTAVLTVSTIMCIAGNSVLAYDVAESKNPSVSTGDSILRYAYITTCRPSLSSSGSIRAVVSLQKALDFSLTLELEEYIGGSWEGTGDYWYLNGNYNDTLSDSCSLESGNRYRLRAYVEVYDEYGDLVENTTKYSSAVTAR